VSCLTTQAELMETVYGAYGRIRPENGSGARRPDPRIQRTAADAWDVMEVNAL